MAHGMDDIIIESDCKEFAFAPAAPETLSLQCQAGEVRAVRGGNSQLPFLQFQQARQSQSPAPQHHQSAAVEGLDTCSELSARLIVL